MRIDWQMYEDGQLGPEAMREAEDALRSGSDARKELEGLRAFRKTVREAAMREPVPHKSLESRLSSVVGQTARPQWRMRFAIAAAAVCALALAFVAYDQFVRPDGTIEVRQKFDDPREASDWASDRSHLEIPDLQSLSVGPLDSVHAASGWACFDYTIGGEVVHVLVSQGMAKKTGCHSVSTSSGVVYVQVGSSNVRLNRRALLFVVMGTDLDRNTSVAESLGALLGPDR